MAPLMQYLTRLCWLMREGVPVADVRVYVPGEDVFARMGTATADRSMPGGKRGW
jgi:hypothetical protein